MTSPESASSTTANPNDIAVVGLALHVPGADTPLRFWNNLRSGVESVRRFSEEDLAAAGVSAELLANPNYVRSGAVLENLAMFDAEFFGLSPKEAAIMDPQHRHFLECAWEALESAGHPPEKFDGRIGVFAGCGMGAYFTYNLLSNPELVQSVGLFLLRHTGNDKDFLATRVSYCFDLKGPSVNVQTACSTSLVAIHTACQSLLSGECDLALAGGVTIELPHNRGYLFKKNEILSPDGHCRAFDHRAQGTIFGSGAGVAALRRLEDALRDGDPIYAIVKGSAVNNDGASKVGYFAPSVDGQAAAATEALAVADVSADTIGYVECHGTGTPIGDPIEIAALTQAYRQTTERSGYCAIGSVKTNIGHLDTAAGVVGMAKAALALQQRQLPPSLNYEAPNPSIDFASSPFVVNVKLQEWKAGATPRRAAVNSLGVGGTNAHVVLEEAPAVAPSSPAARPYQLLTLSARSRSALDDASQRLAAHLREHPEQNLADVAYTLLQGRKKFDVRRVVAARDHAEAAALLEAADAARVFTHKAADAKPSLVFMFPGGGAQYPRMGRDLYDVEPVFRQWIDRGLTWLQGKLDVDLRELWFAPSERDEELRDKWERPSIQLPAIFLCEYALAQLWHAWGMKPAALLGHSLGENTAAALAGVFSFEDALGLVTLRGKLFERVAPGGMISVPLAPEAILPLLNDRLDLATVNGPEFCTVSGADDALDEFAARLAAEGIDAKRVPIKIAAHSRLLEPILRDFEKYLRSIRLNKPVLPIVSNRTGTWLTDAQATDPAYWVEHLRNTVRFADGVGTLLKTPGRLFLEVGPGKTLASLVRQHRDVSPAQTVVSSLRHPKENISDVAFFTTVLGRLWASDVELDESLLRKDERRRRVTLPTYAFQRQSYWIEPGKVSAGDDHASTSLARLADVNDWYYRPVWRLREIESLDATLEPTTWLVFLDDAGVGDRLTTLLRNAGHEVVTVRPGDAYFQHGLYDYVLSPEHGRDGYEALVRDLTASGKAPSRIVHLWLTTADQSYRPGSSFFHRNQECGFYSLLFLAQAMSTEKWPKPLHVAVVANDMQQTRNEPLLHPDKATVLGPVGVIPRELEATTCACIDLKLPKIGRFAFARRRHGAEALDRLVDQLFAELQQPGANGLVALRDDRRYEHGYTKHKPLAADKKDVASLPGIRPRGVYLITGGFGGIGLATAEHLARTAKAKLVLVGRSALPPPADWDAWLRSHSEENGVSRKIRQVRELESYGAEVLAAKADVTDVEAVRAVVAETKRRFGTLHGVVHAAGILQDNLISLKTQTEAETVFAPKVHGTLVLNEALQNESLDFFVLFSSTSTATAPAGQVDYVAANAFLNAFAQSCNRAEHRVIALNWGIWNEVGMAADAVDKSRQAHRQRGVEEPVVHPLFDYRLGGLHDPRMELVGRHAAATHWVYDEHRTAAGQAILPGTGYLELARAALAEIDESRSLEIQDLFFLSPLVVDDDGARDVTVALARNEQGYTLEVSSRAAGDAQAGPQLHAQARIVAVEQRPASQIDIAVIAARCPSVRHAGTAAPLNTKQKDHLRFGPRWKVLQETAFGQNEALAVLALSQAYVADLEHYALHPALMDLATGFAMDLICGYETCSELWVPISYKRIACFAPLTQSIVSWVRNRGDNRADGQFAAFDVTIADETGRVLVEIEEFVIKRLNDTVEFGAARPAASGRTVELATDEEDTVSPAEAHFRAHLRSGIRPQEGVEALVAVLSRVRESQIIVSSLDLHGLIRQVDAMAAPRAAEPGAKFSRPQLEGEFVEPRDNIERALVTIWEDLLGVTSVGVRDSFFDLGGHSLIAVRLFAQIKKAFHVEFPISVLFEAPTVEACANLLRREIPADGDAPPTNGGENHHTRYTHLVSMHEGSRGTKTPIFIVAGMFGNVLNLRHLAHLVGHDRPCYGLQARGLYGEHAPHATFEEAAADYLKEMRSVQPHGPYLVAGFSGGGLTAYEIAHQLRRDGEEVAFLGMLDTPLPVSEAMTTRDKIKMHLQRIAREKHRYFWNFIAGRAAWEFLQLKRRIFGGEAPAAKAQFHSETIHKAFLAACDVYQPPRYTGKLALFRPKLNPTHVFGPERMINVDRRFVYHDNGWSRHGAEVEIFEVPGDHDSMVLEPNVRVLGARLRKAIDQAEARCRAQGCAKSTPVEATNDPAVDLVEASV